MDDVETYLPKWMNLRQIHADPFKPYVNGLEWTSRCTKGDGVTTCPGFHIVDKELEVVVDEALAHIECWHDDDDEA